MYTSAHPELFSRYADLFFSNGLDQISVGIDYHWDYLEFYELEYPKLEIPSEKNKALDGYKALKYVRDNFPGVDTQATFTLHRKNWDLMYGVIKDMSEMGVITDVNLIHYNIDGKFDFFPARAEMSEYLFPKGNLKQWASVVFHEFQKVLEEPKFKKWIFNPEYFGDQMSPLGLLNYRYHCNGDPLGGPSIEANGYLRVCPYRKGDRVSKMTIFDLDSRKGILDWKIAEMNDAMECPGCSWGCSMYYKWRQNLTEEEQYAQFSRR
jgi:hypothetical protein